jgi:SAM-dependent methyltransferase
MAARSSASSLFRSWADSAFTAAMEANVRVIQAALASAPPGGRLLDLGCDDGARTLIFARASRAAAVSGVDVVQERVEEARSRGVDAVVSDIGERLPYDDATFDAVVSNQVIEHVVDTDHFVAESRRVLKPNGILVTSTENLASWHNILALALGWQPFSLTNVTATRAGLGNPLAVHRDAPPGEPSWQHRRVFSYRGLRELIEAHGFTDVAVRGAGYFPLPAALARWEPRHAAFLTAIGRA